MKLPKKYKVIDIPLVDSDNLDAYFTCMNTEVILSSDFDTFLISLIEKLEKIINVCESNYGFNRNVYFSGKQDLAKDILKDLKSEEK